MATPRRTQSQWQAIAERRLDRLIQIAQSIPALKKMVQAGAWNASVQLVGPARMRSLNHEYWEKDVATDVLSFVSMPIFREQHGYLGELVICLSVMKRQAKELKHSETYELDVLLVHGFLHLLGMDHEASEKEARRMARWEEKLLTALRSRGQSGGRSKVSPARKSTSIKKKVRSRKSVSSPVRKGGLINRSRQHVP